VEKYVTSRQATDDNLIRRKRMSCWIIQATNTHSEYVIFIPFPRRQWLHERASMSSLYVYFHSCKIILQSTPTTSK
jgi:hypothetical protein